MEYTNKEILYEWDIVISTLLKLRRQQANRINNEVFTSWNTTLELVRSHLKNKQEVITCTIGDSNQWIKIHKLLSTNTNPVYLFEKQWVELTDSITKILFNATDTSNILSHPLMKDIDSFTISLNDKDRKLIYDHLLKMNDWIEKQITS